MAQVVECLPSKHEALTSTAVPSKTKTKQNKKSKLS
jgi:hypothetical protein